MSYEPMVIDAKTVAEHLEQMHLPRMAAWALAQGNAVARERLLAEVYQRRLKEANERLEAYEPKPKHEPVSCVPPPESSD